MGIEKSWWGENSRERLSSTEKNCFNIIFSMMIKSTCLETIKFHKNILASEDREFIKKEKEKQQQ